MKTVAILSNAKKDKDFKTAEAVYEIIKSKYNVISHINMHINGIKYTSEDYVLRNAELIIVLGGDGTILRTARKVCKIKTPILGINMGRVGFLAEIEKNSLEKYLSRLIDGKYSIETRSMLYACVERNGQRIAKFNALNDVVISCNSFKRMVDVEIFVDGTKLDSYSADGVIASTPTGSTAYSLSAGGPLVDSSLDIMLITPICPHSLTARSIILPGEKTVKIRLREKTARHSILTIDGQEGFDLEDGDVIKICKSNYQATTSRDLQELRITKLMLPDGTYKYAAAKLPEINISEKMNAVFSQCLVSVDYAMNIVVVKTFTGAAQAVAAAIDSFVWDEIVGSIAGDDTIMIVVRNEKSAKQLTVKLSRFIA